MNNKVSDKDKWKKIVGIMVFVSLLLSIVYATVKIIYAPAGTSSEMYEKVRSDYVLMLLQCILGIVVMAIPSIVEKKASIDIPNNMEIMYFIFLYCAIYLGEVRNFYYLIPNWDTILHAFSGAMLGALGFSLVSFLNDSEHTHIDLSTFFVALFAFCFALASGAVWEIYEFLADEILATNMQKYMLADGTILVGHAALMDTMEDFIVDSLSSLAVTIAGYYSIKNKKPQN